MFVKVKLHSNIMICTGMSIVDQDKYCVMKSAFQHIRFIFLLLCIAAWSTNVNAARGCRGVTTGNLYTVSGNDAQGEFWYQAPLVSNPQNIYCITTTTTPCVVKRTDGQGYYSPAFIVDYVPILQCPLDSGLWVLLLVSGGLGLYVLKSSVLP